MCRTPINVDAGSQEASCWLELKVDASTIMKTPESSWRFRIAWAPVKSMTGESSMQYDVQFIGWGGKRYTFRTADGEAGIVLPNRMIREKVGDTFTVQIRALSNHSFGEWSQTSRVMSVAKPSPNEVTATPRPESPPALLSGELAVEAFPYIATRKTATVKKCGKANDAVKKCEGSLFERFVSGFRRATAKV
eukprot:gnl/MRDRNA2_/MRDRNA2_92337_c0_seq1.p1 gnl/MRDRNA2_/MRDRNA2_92337_c0~~gnl/MRDRNA2_/MRDRNA2_92337_c0_seq1.p1  ORF type:complete len:192 (+),score=31.52 gnl/MRDRNA2_/MRDRNA2_92337_c0_seq1:81-656(+)